MQAPHVAVAPPTSTEEPQVAEAPELNHLEENPQRVAFDAIVSNEGSRVLIARLTVPGTPPKPARDACAVTRRKVSEVVFHDLVAVLALDDRSVEQANAREVLDVDANLSQG